MSLKNNRHSTNWVTFTDMSSATASGEEPVFLPQVKTNAELPFGLPRAGFFLWQGTGQDTLSLET